MEGGRGAELGGNFPERAGEPGSLPVRLFVSPTPIPCSASGPGSLTAQQPLGTRLFWRHVEGAQEPNCRGGKGDGGEKRLGWGEKTRKEPGEGPGRKAPRGASRYLLEDWRVGRAPQGCGFPGPAQARAPRRPNSGRGPAAAGSASSQPRWSKSPSVNWKPGPRAPVRRSPLSPWISGSALRADLMSPRHTPPPPRRPSLRRYPEKSLCLRPPLLPVPQSLSSPPKPLFGAASRPCVYTPPTPNSRPCLLLFARPGDPLTAAVAGDDTSLPGRAPLKPRNAAAPLHWARTERPNHSSPSCERLCPSLCQGLDLTLIWGSCKHGGQLSQSLHSPQSYSTIQLPSPQTPLPACASRLTLLLVHTNS